MTECQESEWQCHAVETQNQFCAYFGFGREYDSFGKSNEFYIKKKIGFSLFGGPSEMPKKDNCFIGYSPDQLEPINKICKKIVELGFSGSRNEIKMGVLFVILRLENKYNVEEPVFKIALDGEKICFVDKYTRVYKDWDHYLSTNELPRCHLCYPENGMYTCINNCVQVSFMKSPACNLSLRFRNGLDTAGTVASAAAIATGFVTSAPVAVVGVAATTIGTGIYSTARNIESLVDRYEHGQSVKLSDKEARSQIICIVGSAAGCVAGGVTHLTQKALASGKTVGKAGMLITKGLNWSSAAVNAASILNTSKHMYDKHSEGELTKRDFFNLSCEVMFFAAACRSIRNTNNKMSDLNSSNILAQENTILEKMKLTKTQKRNLQERNKRARKEGELAGQSHELNSPSVNNTFSFNRLHLMFQKYASVCPKIESLFNKGNSICHDYYQMYEGTITLDKFLINTSIILQQLYNEFKDDVKNGVKVIQDLFKRQSFSESYKKGFFEEAAADEFFSYMLWDNIFEVERAVDGCYDLADTNSDDDICTMDWILADICDFTLELISIHFSSSSKNAFCICLHAVCAQIVKEVKIRIKKYNSELQKTKEKLREKFQQKQFDQAYGVGEDIGKFMFKASVRSVDVRLTSLITPEIAELQYTDVHLWEAMEDETISLYLRKPSRMPVIATYLKWMSDIIESTDWYILKSDEVPKHFREHHCKIEGDIKNVCIITPLEQLGLPIEGFIFRTFEDKSLITLITMIKRNFEKHQVEQCQVEH